MVLDVNVFRLGIQVDSLLWKQYGCVQVLKAGLVLSYQWNIVPRESFDGDEQDFSQFSSYPAWFNEEILEGHRQECSIPTLVNLFAELSSFKIQEGIIVGPQIRKVLKDKEFENILTLK